MASARSHRIVRMLQLSFAAIVLLLALTQVVAYVQWRHVQSNVDDIQNNAMASVRLVGRMTLDVERQRVLIDRHIAETGGGMKDIEAAIDVLQADYAAAARQYDPLATFAGEADAWQRMSRDVATVDEQTRRVLELSRVNRDLEAGQLTAVAGSGFDAIDADGEALVRINGAAADQASAEVSALETTVLYVRTSLAVAVIVITFAMARWLSAITSRTLSELVDAIAQRDTAHAARIAAVEALRHADRLTTVGKLASGMAHELGTPLNVISGYAKQIATGQETGNEACAVAQIIVDQTQRVTNIVRHLLDYSRRGEFKLTVADVRPSLARALAMVAVTAKKHDVRVRYREPDQSLSAAVNEGKLEQVVVNLVINAIHASPSGADIELTVAVDEVAPPGKATKRRHIRLDITDHGVGIPPEHVQRVFEPFFTTKPVGEGTGLGLAVSHGIIEEHRGWIAVASILGEGSCFSIFLPEAAAVA